jgi:hypothetical protein
MGWGMNTPTDKLTQPYYRDLYEEASGPILRMVKLLEDRFAMNDINDGTNHFQNCVFPLPSSVIRILDVPLLDAIDQCLEEARSLAVQERVRHNVEKLGIAVGYWRLAYEFYRSMSVLEELDEGEVEERRKVLGICISSCEDIMNYLEGITQVDVVAREMALKIYWKNLCEELERKFKETEG